MKRISLGLGIALAGVAVHMIALWIADQTVSTFPPVTDLLMQHIPYRDFFGIGEVVFWLLMVAFGVALLSTRKKDIGYIFALIGLFYAGRGLFLLFLPIGAPADAPALTDRFVLYPYGSHAFFPGGHAGIMFVLALLVPLRRVRIALMLATLLFGFGSVITRAHYTADILGGVLLAYGVWNFGERYIKAWFITQKEAGAKTALPDSSKV